MDEPEWVDAFGGSSVADERWLRQVQAGIQNGSTPHDERSWTPRNLADVEDVDPEPPTLGGIGLLYPSKRHVFSGPQETAKTLAAYISGLSVVRQGKRVLLIDFEMGERDAKRRFVELGATDEELELIDYVEPEQPLTERIAQSLLERSPELVIVDASAGAYDLQGLDDNKRGDVERFSSTFMRPFWRAKVATLVIDHVVKNVEARGNYAIGSERKIGGVDVHLGFTVVHAIKRGGKGVYKITTHKDRPGFHKRGRLADMELVSDPETHTITWAFTAAPEVDEDHPFRPTGLMEKVSVFLEMCYERTSKNKVEKAVPGKTDYKRLALELLIDEGYVDFQEGHGLESIRPYREAEDTLAPGSPHLAPNTVESGSPLRPTPYGGGEGEANHMGRGEVDDGIPF